MKLSQVAINGDSLGLQAQVPLRPGPYFGGILLWTSLSDYSSKWRSLIVGES
jgi:hypothetical protein